MDWAVKVPEYINEMLRRFVPEIEVIALVLDFTFGGEGIVRRVLVTS